MIDFIIEFQQIQAPFSAPDEIAQKEFHAITPLKLVGFHQFIRRIYRLLLMLLTKKYATIKMTDKIFYEGRKIR